MVGARSVEDVIRACRIVGIDGGASPKPRYAPLEETRSAKGGPMRCSAS
jgi:hypothetical protein